jgi:hypothetical protein
MKRTTITVHAPHEVTANLHVEHVWDEMRRRGAPRIRAVEMDDGSWQALEGSHRLWVASEQEHPIVIVPCNPNDRITTDVLGKRRLVRQIVRHMVDMQWERPMYQLEAEIK